MSWTDERVEQLRELWSQGLSASQIAAQLGGVSRNAVIGKAHRLGLQGRPSPIRTTGGQAPRRRSASPRPTLPRPTVESPVSAVALRVRRRESEA